MIYVLGWGVGKWGWGDGGGSVCWFFIVDIVVVRSYDILFFFDIFKNYCLFFFLKILFYFECFVIDVFGVKIFIVKKVIVDFLIEIII